MALLTGDQVAVVYQDGSCGKTVLLALKGVTAADTVDLVGILKVIKRCGMVSDTGTTIAACTIAGTVVTIPTGPASDGVWLLAVGVSA